jgi:hypothetical protein
MLRLLLAHKRDVEFERLRILDMYLLFPSLLHRTSMTRDMRSEFTRLHIPKPEEKFVRLPSNAAVFQELRIYQTSAVGQLAARGLIVPEALKRGLAIVDERMVPSELFARIMTKNSSEDGLIRFLEGPFSSLSLRGTESMYRRAGLPIRVLAE